MQWSVFWLTGLLATSQVQDDPNSPVRNVSGNDGNKTILTPPSSLVTSQVPDEVDSIYRKRVDVTASKEPPTTSGPLVTPEVTDTLDAVSREIFADKKETSDRCICVPYYLCSDSTNEFEIIDIRQEESCEHYLDVCCVEANILNDPIILTRPQNESDTGVDIVSTGPVAGGGTTQYHSRGCGYRNPEGIGFTIVGNKEGESQFGEFPWMAAVLRKEPLDVHTILKVYKCGGALIHPKMVLTAAHCLIVSNNFIENEWMVRVGEWDTQTKKEIYPSQDRNVVDIILHPDFHAGPLFNDAALLVLDSPVDLQENVDIICLPPKDLVPDQKECLASGWGRDVFGKEGKYQVILKRIELQVVEHSKCEESLRKTRWEPHFELHKSFMCAVGLSKKDMCNGDGGSPLVCPVPGQPGRYYQAGIVAWGTGCGENGIPGIYTNVAHLRPWIDEQLHIEMLDKKIYDF